MKVDFMIVGAQKSGTTSLYRLLEQHPSICFSKTKEPNFWCAVKNWKQEITSYHKLFEEKEGVLYGEASTSYTLLPILETGKSLNGRFSADKLPYRLTNARISDDLHEYNPKLKFIYIVRRPFERIVSNYKHFYQRGYTNAGLNEAVVSERFLIDFTRYHTQISPYIERFGRENILLLNFDDLKNNQEKIATQVLDFLNLEHKQFSLKETVHANKTTQSKTHYYFDKLPPILVRLLPFIAKRKLKKKPHLSDTSKQIIALMLKNEIQMLEELMQEDLSSWLLY